MFGGYFKDAEKTAEAMTAGRLCPHRRCRLLRRQSGHLKIIDRAKDVGKLDDGALFAPKYIENKLKFYPEHQGGGGLRRRPRLRGRRAQHRPRRPSATGPSATTSSTPPIRNWPARSGRLRHDRGARRRGEPVARRRADDGAARRSGASSILHKELDADDGELTRTQKVRRGFIAERYAPLVEALYDGSSAADISTEVTFEDGRKGVISARREGRATRRPIQSPAHAARAA